jgi:hypothetical protein
MPWQRCRPMADPKSETTASDETCNGWHWMRTAPRDGTRIVVEAGGMVFPAFWGDGLLNMRGEDVGGWHAAEEDKHPPCWSDGICWESNAEGQRSAQPEAWRPE